MQTSGCECSRSGKCLRVWFPNIVVAKVVVLEAVVEVVVVVAIVVVVVVAVLAMELRVIVGAC